MTPPPAVLLAAQRALLEQSLSVGHYLKGAHRDAAIVRRVLRKAAHYAAQAKVNEQELVDYLRAKL